MILKLKWSVESSIAASPDDRVELLIYQPELGEYQISPDGITRDNGELEIELDPHYKGYTVHVYMYLMSSGWVKKKWSNSVYVGSVKFRK